MIDVTTQHEKTLSRSDKVWNGNGSDGESRSGFQSKCRGEDAADAETGDGGNAASEDGGRQDERVGHARRSR